MMVYLIGAGSGLPASYTEEAVSLVRSADLVIGSQRLIRDLGEVSAQTKVLKKSPQILGAIIGARTENPDARVCVLYSGDPGFWSGAEILSGLLEKAGIPYTVLPGISSVQLMAAALGLPWKNWNLVSAHGREADPIAEVRISRETFFLTGGRLTAREICHKLTQSGLGDLRAAAGQDLGSPEEKITKGTCSQLAETDFPSMTVLLVRNEKPAARVSYTRSAARAGLPDRVFNRDEKVPMTKREVRAAIASRLAVRPGETVWDVGAGTGSVSVECALAARSDDGKGAVYAVEQDSDACTLLCTNAIKFFVDDTIQCITGRAPAALADLPVPDAVFVGGSGGELRDIVRTCRRRNPDVRIVVSAVLLETAEEAVKVLSEGGSEPEVVQIQVSRGRALGKEGAPKKHMMLAENPVWLIAGGCD